MHRGPSAPAAWPVLLLAGAALCASGLALAQQAPAAEARAPKVAAPRKTLDQLPPALRHVLQKLDEANAKVVDVKAKVVYERLIPLLEDKRKCKGSLVLKKPNLLVLKLGRPRNEEVRTDGHTWWVINHNDKQVEVYKASERGEGSNEAAFVSFGYGRSSEELLEDYDIELLSTRKGEDGGPTVYRLKFTPVQRPDRPARYGAIEIELADDLWLPRVLVLHEPDDEIIHTYTLRKIVVNSGVDDDVFNYEPPRDYTVIPMDEL